jgi:hypothetical protein
LKKFGIEHLEVEELGEVKVFKIGKYGIQLN